MPIQIHEIKKRALSLILTSFIVGLGYWKIIQINMFGNEIQHGLGWPVVIAPFLLFGLYKLATNKIEYAAILAYPIAITIGVFLGCVSGFFERNTDGLVIQAVISTFGCALSVIWLYKNQRIKVDDKFTKFLLFLTSVLTWTASINFIMSFIDLNWKSVFTGVTLQAIILNAVILILAYMVFIMDLDIIELKLKKGEVKNSESWFFAIELLIDVAWMYLAFIFIILRARERK